VYAAARALGMLCGCCRGGWASWPLAAGPAERERVRAAVCHRAARAGVARAADVAQRLRVTRFARTRRRRLGCAAPARAAPRASRAEREATCPNNRRSHSLRHTPHTGRRGHRAEAGVPALRRLPAPGARVAHAPQPPPHTARAHASDPPRWRR
jgi:hypothetical protein